MYPVVEVSMKVLAYIGALVLFTSFSFPLSAGAFGRSPSRSEVNQTGSTQTAAKTSAVPPDSKGTPQAVPEPSSVMLLAIAVGVIAVALVKRRFGQTANK